MAKDYPTPQALPDTEYAGDLGRLPAGRGGFYRRVRPTSSVVTTMMAPRTYEPAVMTMPTADVMGSGGGHDHRSLVVCRCGHLDWRRRRGRLRTTSEDAEAEEAEERETFHGQVPVR